MRVGEEATTCKGRESSICFRGLQICGPAALVNHTRVTRRPQEWQWRQDCVWSGKSRARQCCCQLATVLSPGGVNQVFRCFPCAGKQESGFEQPVLLPVATSCHVGSLRTTSFLILSFSKKTWVSIVRAGSSRVKELLEQNPKQNRWSLCCHPAHC